ncbi:type II toxin-antitoxin system RelE/ParE family toxin [Methylobacterium sp. E-005]|uniref:type II toxin-antitoxin system RelE/ParE family toxin n=1 Tax=Methylobacterium sp. E-005 TaxID=2836549 RepID=UPI001FBB5AEE|nr:type II toxin-antitoxin system RelE/ParE family toxin [Methylobacterium sp. E-005]MCJ2086627.1 type II toxin-antitoxin system RelE/ParE family toxin [Methylobacterium sp. E-005]
MSVRYPPPAARQVEAALDYLAAQSPDAARGLRERLPAVTTLLEAHPSLGHGTGVGHIRRFPLGTQPYSVDSSIDRDAILVHRIRHAFRRPLS